MKTKRRFAIAGIFVGALLAMSPFFGLIGTVWGMRQAMQELGNAGPTDPSKLGSAVGEVLVSTMAGLLMCPLGLLVLGFSIFFYVKNKTASAPQGDAV